ncbi:hypothetical protein N9I49_01195 [Flavobacteriaceae bacterium]|nr:hypothetical protein [Flavobacteriaceae bacterium]
MSEHFSELSELLELLEFEESQEDRLKDKTTIVVNNNFFIF